jgi:hypothetical protein
MNLGMLPRLKVTHTDAMVEGQIYIGQVGVGWGGGLGGWGRRLRRGAPNAPRPRGGPEFAEAVPVLPPSAFNP